MSKLALISLIKLYFSLANLFLSNVLFISRIVERIDSALASLMFCDFDIDCYNLFSLANSVLTNYFLIKETALESWLDMVSAVIFLTSSSNNMPVFLYLLCFILAIYLIYS
jgi:hypothetical protein